MKQWISVLVIVSLVVSLAFAMNGCGKGKDTTGESATGSAVEISAEGDRIEEASTESDVQNDLHGLLEELASDREEMDLTLTVPTINEKYREEYEAMTLPSAKPAAAKTVKQVSASTTAARRETTTQFQFTSPSRLETTAKAVSTTKSSASTTKAATTTTPGTTETTVPDRIPESGVINPANLQPAQSTEKGTYLQKFVLSKVNSGSYTLNLEFTTQNAEEMANVPMSFYKNSKEDKAAFKAHIGEVAAAKMGFPAALGKNVDIRVVGTNLSSNPHLYFAWPGGYSEITDDDLSESKDLLKEYDLVETIFSTLLQPGIEFHGQENFGSYLVETYVDPENEIMTCLYFDGQGIAKAEILDMTKTGKDSIISSYKLELSEGAPDSAFKLSGKKYSEDEMMGLFENLAS